MDSNAATTAKLLATIVFSVFFIIAVHHDATESENEHCMRIYKVQQMNEQSWKSREEARGDTYYRRNGYCTDVDRLSDLEYY